MSEPLAWLKLVPRPRTPTISLRTANSPECVTSRDLQPAESKGRCPSRMSDYLTRTSPTEPEPGLGPLSKDDVVSDLIVRDQDKVWYNPVSDIPSLPSFTQLGHLLD